MTYRQPHTEVIYSEPRRRPSARVIVAVIVAALVLIGIISAIITAVILGGDDDTPDTGLPFPGKRDGDVALPVDSVAVIDGVEVTTSEIVSEDGPAGEALLCSSVVVANLTDEAVAVNEEDWSLQKPSGPAELFSVLIGEDAWVSQEVASGATASGKVCFTAGGGVGTYALLYDPGFDSGEGRYGWVSSR